MGINNCSVHLRLCRLALPSLLVPRLAKSAGTRPSGTLCTCSFYRRGFFWLEFSKLIYVFRLPPNEDGEWWELSDESRGGLPYYYQTKTGDTVWERPEGFVIPLGIIQVCSITASILHTPLNNTIGHVSWSSTFSNGIPP